VSDLKAFEGLVDALGPLDGKRTWYIEARVGAGNFRDEHVRFINDRRGTGEERSYINLPAKDAFAALLDALRGPDLALPGPLKCGHGDRQRVVIVRECECGDSKTVAVPDAWSRRAGGAR
jgi:hypothetical protein